jgi:hypothetical protein
MTDDDRGDEPDSADRWKESWFSRIGGRFPDSLFENKRPSCSSRLAQLCIPTVEEKYIVIALGGPHPKFPPFGQVHKVSMDGVQDLFLRRV